MLDEMPLPIMGLISESPLPELTRQIAARVPAFPKSGSALENPFLTLQTLCFAGLPLIRLTDQGLANVGEGTMLSLFVNPEDLQATNP